QRRSKQDMEPRVYSRNGDVYTRLREMLINLPQRVAKNELPAAQDTLLDAGSRTLLQEYAANDTTYRAAVQTYLEQLQKLDLIILPDEQRSEELTDKLRY